MRVRVSAIITLFALVFVNPSPASADDMDQTLNGIRTELASGKFSEALTWLDALRSMTPAQSFRADYYRAYAHARQGKPDLAEAELLAILPSTGAGNRAEFLDLTGIYGESARALLGSIYKGSKRHDLLPRLYAEMIEDYHQNPEWQYLLADSYFSLKRYNEAAEGYGRFAELHPDYVRFPEACFRRAESLRQASRYQESYDYLTALPKPTPDWEVRIAAMRAELLAVNLKRDYDLSNRLCEEMIAKYPNNKYIFACRYRLSHNWLYDRPPGKVDYVKGRQILIQLVQDFPNEGMALEMKIDIAFSFEIQNGVENAIVWYEKALREHPDKYPEENWHSYIKLALAGCYNTKGDKVKARAIWQEMVDKYPEDRFTRWARLHLTESEGGPTR